MKLNTANSFLVSALRAGAGRTTGRLGPRPAVPIQLYEFESCPFCRKVREAVTNLDLTVEVFPCPKGGERFRPSVKEQGGKAQFPFMIDPNTKQALYESDEIIRHLYDRYGVGSAPWFLRLGPLTTMSAALASIPQAGDAARPSRRPEKPLVLYSFEASPYCRLVRDTLCRLELPYVLHSIGKGSPGRAAFIEKTKKMQVPYLIDPNEDVSLFESRDI
ncbi:MAG: glutathione S-transferase N-terminal domain-containing protein, partial [Planctomycetota bacterium]